MATRPVWTGPQVQGAFLDVWGEPEEHHNLGDYGPTDALAAGDGGLVGDFPGVELFLPFLGEAQEAF